jgi:prepilin-type N-terminal cleavage/methylation domain-containing protein
MKKSKSFLKTLAARKKLPAFSLIELLVAIAIIGILAGVAFNYILFVRQDAVDNKDRRNAQQVANIAMNWHISGKKFLPSENIDNVITEIITKHNLSGGLSKVSVELPNLKGDDIIGLKRYLDWPNALGVPIYDPKK